MSLASNAPTFDQPFEQLYQQLLQRIPRYNPDWTNYNEGDPGVTLLQLFTWLTELTLHRMNDVPLANYLKFAQLLALELDPRRPAEVMLTFKPKAGQMPAVIPQGSRFSGSGGDSTVTFETTAGLGVIGAPLAAVVVIADGTISPLPLAAPPAAVPFWPFGRNPAAGDALYLGFTPDAAVPAPFPQRMCFAACAVPPQGQVAAQAVGPQAQSAVPPATLVWEFLVDPSSDVWEALGTLSDGSVALTRDGLLEIEGPTTIAPQVYPALANLQADPLYWLRVRVDAGAYPAGRAPQLDFLLPNAVEAINLITEDPYVLGESNGQAGQSFAFPSPFIDPASLVITVTPAGGTPDAGWSAIDDLAAATPDDKRYALNSTAGTIAFGDGATGYIPPAGAEILAAVWRHGGGADGNQVVAGAVTTIVSQVAGIESVTNPRAAAGGADEETLDHFIRHAPERLRSSDARAVTAADFERIARTVDGVASAKALGSRHPDFPNVEVPGAITVYVAADTTAMPPTPSAGTIRGVCAALDPVRLITTEVYVAPATFVEARVEARLVVAPTASPDQVRRDALARLAATLNPLAREFGASISGAEVYASLVGGNPGGVIRAVENLVLFLDGQAADLGTPLPIGREALVYPGTHGLVVRPDVSGS